MSTYGLWLSAAGMKVSDHRQALLTNNMANMKTAGFKEDLAVVTRRRVESRENAVSAKLWHPVLDSSAGGLNVRAARWNPQQGPIEPTGRPLDVAIEGDGFFGVTDGTATRYTRAGAFALNRDGTVVLSTEAGQWKVLDRTGLPVAVNPGGGDVEVSDNGMIRQGGAVVGQLGVFGADDAQSLRKVGENLFEAGGEMKPLEGKLRSGALEGSNFDVMRGLAAMLEASRFYQMNATLLTMQDALTGRVLELGKG